VELRLPTAAAGPASAPELDFEVRDGGVLRHAAGPTLRFDLGVRADPPVVRSVSLSVEIRIAATRRRYEAPERDALFDLFGPTGDWGRNLRTLHWTRVALNVPAFTGATQVDLAVPCTYDLDVTASRYFNALDGGDVPLEFLFSGTVFYSGDDGRLQIGRVGWEKEAAYALPVSEWRSMMDTYFPGSSWLRLRRAQFDRLTAYRTRRALTSWEDTIDALLDGADD
jgi:hypothetical protein